MTVVCVPLKRKGETHVMKVDYEDWQKLSQNNWRADSRGYCAHSDGQRSVYLHRAILNVTDPKIVVDHIDSNRLNNRRDNLRTCTIQQNVRNAKRSSANTSGYRGVTFCKQTNKYVAQICHNSKHINLGRFNSKVEAAIAYNIAAQKFHGEFARLNEV